MISYSSTFFFTAEGDGDSDSIHSVFRGALDVQVLEIPWETDIKRRVDIQRDENDWETRIRAVDGGEHLIFFRIFGLNSVQGIHNHQISVY